MSPEYDLLGPAEKLVAKQLHDGFAKSLQPLRELAEKVEKLAEVDFEAVLIDPEKKGTAVSFAEVLGHMPQRIADIQLGVLIAETIFTSEGTTA